MFWCVKIPDFMWLKHFYLEDHGQSSLNTDMHAQFSMSLSPLWSQSIEQLASRGSASVRGGGGS